MSYLVLARKWRPKRFAELVGQEHVVKALTNALDSGRVHHAFLFTGTRGVGKTTIARIFAKSLNCEQGQGADPCGRCSACLDIDAGRFVDLLEIDAASNTGVDDVRDLIDNAQYMPARGRIKVYLIDEVHMLSKSAFNALLKTLEEPPEHVKFLLATTDPQKLPVTVLSRCLQFNLRRLEHAQIAAQMRKIVDAENINADDQAIALLARGADGSLRDGLSLLDQAIAYTGGHLNEIAVNAMLGTVDRTQIAGLLGALAAGDGQTLLQTIEQLASFSPEFGQVLDDLTVALHAIQVCQLVPGAQPTIDRVPVETLATGISPELVQLWYQLAVNGRRDLAIAPSPRTGFEMTLLRMLAFRPAGNANTAVRSKAPIAATTSKTPSARSAVPASTTPRAMAKPDQVDAASVQKRELPIDHLSSNPQSLQDNDAWLSLIDRLALHGPTGQLAAHLSLEKHDSVSLKLLLPQDYTHLLNDNTEKQLTTALREVLGSELKLQISKINQSTDTTLAQRRQNDRDTQQSQAEDSFLNDPVVRKLIESGAQPIPGSIKPN